MGSVKQGTLPRKESKRRYACVRPTLNTFDIINCEHKNLFWRLIGHTAMVYKDYHTGQVFVYESTTRNKFGISGVQLTPMRLWLPRYPGKVKVRRLYEEGPAVAVVAAARIQVGEHIRRYRGTPYPDLSDPKQKRFVIDSAIDLPFGIGKNIDRDDIMFCTQLVVDCYRYCCLYTGKEPPSERQPDDMREGRKFEDELAEGLKLGREVDLK